MTSSERPGPAPRTRWSRYRVGLDALASFWPVASEPIRYPHRDETEALRGDFRRIGDDLRGVIEREAAREPIKQD